MTAEIHYNDTGTVFRATIKDENNSAIDISGATALKFKFRRPDGVVLEKNGTLTNDGTDGIMEYATVSGDLSDIGHWQIQSYAQLATGMWHSDILSFQVHRNIS